MKDLNSWLTTAPSWRQLTYIALKSCAGGEWGQAAADFLHYCVTNIKLHHEIETSSQTREKLTFFLMHIEQTVIANCLC